MNFESLGLLKCRERYVAEMRFERKCSDTLILGVNFSGFNIGSIWIMPLMTPSLLHNDRFIHPYVNCEL
jgi:hypothetical protein